MRMTDAEMITHLRNSAETPAHAAAMWLALSAGEENPTTAFSLGFLAALELCVQFPEYTAALAFGARDVMPEEEKVAKWPSDVVDLFPVVTR